MRVPASCPKFPFQHLPPVGGCLERAAQQVFSHDALPSFRQGMCRCARKKLVHFPDQALRALHDHPAQRRQTPRSDRSRRGTTVSNLASSRPVSASSPHFDNNNSWKRFSSWSSNRRGSHRDHVRQAQALKTGRSAIRQMPEGLSFSHRPRHNRHLLAMGPEPRPITRISRQARLLE